MLRPRPVVFAHAVRAFLSGVLQRRGVLEAARNELEQLELDVNAPRDLPVEGWWAMIAVSARHLVPGPADEAAFEFIGGEVIRGYAESTVGRSSFDMLAALGPQQALAHIAAQYRSANNVTTVQHREVGPREGEVTMAWIGGIPWPSYFCGVLGEGMRLIGYEAKVTVSPGEDGAWRYLVRW